MTFPINSTSVQTKAVERIGRVLRKTRAADDIAYAGVYNCRSIAGTSLWSQHSYGNAIDLFPKGTDVQKRLRSIANRVVYQATHRTPENHFRRLPVAQVIDHDDRRVWEPATGWRYYSGATGAHVHVSGAPVRYGRPACAG